MEEKKRENKKLTPEQLEEVTRQLSAQFDAVVKENQQLKTIVQKLQLDNLFAELNFRFKVLENASCFKQEFVERITSEIEDIMTAKEENKDEERTPYIYRWGEWPSHSDAYGENDHTSTILYRGHLASCHGNSGKTGR